LSKTGTISVAEIQARLGLSKNQVRTVMKKYSVYHDGSQEMLYPAPEAYEVINKEEAKSQRSSVKRQQISENRKNRQIAKSGTKSEFVQDKEFLKTFGITPFEIRAVKEEFGFEEKSLKRLTLDGFLKNGGRQKINAFLESYRENVDQKNRERRDKERELYITQAEICDTLGIDRHEIKSAIQSGLLVPKNGSKRFLRSDIESIDVAGFKEKLTWEHQYPTTAAAKLLGVSNAVFLRFAQKHNIKEVGSYTTGQFNVEVKLWRFGDFAFLIDSEEVLKSIEKSENIKQSHLADAEYLRQKISDERQRIRDGVTVGIRDRNQAPEYVALHLGPTNSGKTYNALENLCDEYEKNPYGTYVYAGPLRMLAFEVYEKLSDRFGRENVGFITGEEAINPEAAILATTVEMAPEEGDVLIVDEAHWVIDEDRGHYWTKLLLGGKYKRIHVIAAREVKDDLLPLLEDAWVCESFEYERRTGITYEGTLPLEKIPPKTAVVCFSRKSVYAMAAALQQAGKTAGVLYGALPLYARKEQIQDFISGKFDIIVTTDVIGHGINLPIDNVVFAETEKYDGKIRRDLHSWEAGQIAGRAGRYGLSDRGRVYTVTGRRWFTKDADLVKQGVAVAGGKEPSDLVVDKPLVAPKFGDLGLFEDDQIHMNYALEVWDEAAEKAFRERSIKPAPLDNLRANLESVSESLDCYLNLGDEGKKIVVPMGGSYSLKRDSEWKIPVLSLWQLVSGPFDFQSPVLEAASRWLQQGGRADSSLIYDCFSRYVASADHRDLESLEQASKSNSELKMVSLMFADVNGKLGNFPVTKLAEAEVSLNRRIVALLAEAIAKDDYGTCERCEKECSPWFKFCDGCFNDRK
jgi:ATP-dependent RNA helicase SUPV3L1/SUV3